MSNEPGLNELYLQAFEASKAALGTERTQVSSGGAFRAERRGDGRELFYMSTDLQMMAVDRVGPERSKWPLMVIGAHAGGERH